MRRCKYFYQYTNTYNDYITREKKMVLVYYCTKKRIPYEWNGESYIPCLFIQQDCYTPVEIDPYWKDIVDETNRRLYDR